MDQSNASDVSSNVNNLRGKSWTAYVGTGLISIFLLPFAVSTAWKVSWILGVFSLSLALAFVVYRVLVIRSYALYFDDAGVWVHSGVLPWSKGVSGVKWRDLDEAVFFQTFWSWLFKSYSMRIGHRFTKSNEIYLTHMDFGHVSVMEINKQHQELVRLNALG